MLVMIKAESMLGLCAGIDDLRNLGLWCKTRVLEYRYCVKHARKCQREC